MASDQVVVSVTEPARGEARTVASFPATSTATGSNSDGTFAKTLKRSRPENLLDPNGQSPVVGVGFTALQSPKSPRTAGAFSPRFSPAPMTGAAALEDERRRREDQQRSRATAMSENPGHKVLTSLKDGGGAMSRPQDGLTSATTMSDAMSTVAKAVTIPSTMQYDDKAETSPISVTSLASLGSSAPTATASTTAAASPGTVLGVSEQEPRDSRSLTSDAPVLDAKASSQSLSYPGSVLREQENSRGLSNPAMRGQSLPGGQGLSQLLSPARSYSNKKHKCPFCETEFTRHHNLKSHLLTHSQEKPFICPTCQMRFRRLHDLKRHTKLHTGERPHICPRCKRKFARGDALARHSKGHGACAGRRASQGSGGGDDEYDESHMGEGDDTGMEGVIYDEPEHHEGGSDDERRFSLPTIKAHHVGSGQGSQEAFAPHARSSSTYPPAGPRPPRARGAPLFPSNMDSGSISSMGVQNSVSGGHSAHTNLSTAAAAGGNSLFAQTGMTESPKPLSPTSHRGSLDASMHGRNRSPSLNTQLQQTHFGRRQPERSPPQGILPSPYGSKLPAIAGLAPPEPRYTLPSQVQANNHNGGQQGPGMNSVSAGNPSFQPNMSVTGHGRGGMQTTPQHQASGSGDFGRNMFASGDQSVWPYVQNLEKDVKHLSEKLADLEKYSRSQEEKIERLTNEIVAMRNHLSNPTQLVQPQPPTQSGVSGVNR
jgi:hypothetical protein